MKLHREDEPAKKSARLQFTKEERAEPALKKPIRQAEKAADMLDDAKAKIPQRKVLFKERIVDSETGRKKVRLRFEDVEKPEPASPKQVLIEAPVAELRKQVRETEDDNAGVEVTHLTEDTADTVLHTGKSVSHARKMKPYRATARAERKADAANIEALYQKSLLEHPDQSSSMLSRWQQRQAIKRQYAAAKTGKAAAAGTQVAKGAEKAVQSVADKAKRIVETFSKGKKGWLIIGVLASLAVMLMNGISSCSQFSMGGLNAILTTSFVSEDRDMEKVDKAYTRLESALDRRIDNIEREYAGYDEYRYSINEIGHNPYVLMSYLTAKYVSFELPDVQADLESLFSQQYSLSVSETIEIRYRTERQPVPTIDPRTGREKIVMQDVEVPYEYRILTVELTNRGLAAVVNAQMDTEQAEMYSVLMQTKGNKPELFSEEDNPFVGTLDFTPPEPYAIPPEALSDPAFAALIAEANKYLGYPYVWGGSKPSTSFDCSGFTCWVLNHSGVASVGRTNARGLYKRSTVVSRANARPGDLVFFTGARAAEIGHPVTHVGIYVGNGMMIHCAGNGVEYKSIDDSKYYRTHLYAFGRL